MGLDMSVPGTETEHEYCYSYSAIHVLRRYAMALDGIVFPEGSVLKGWTKEIEEKCINGSYRELIMHSDCEGGYVPGDWLKGLEKDFYQDGYSFLLGDIDKLYEELKEVKKHFDNGLLLGGFNKEYLGDIINDFYGLVHDAVEGDYCSGCSILMFH